MRKLAILIVVLSVFSASNAFADQVVKVAQTAWDGLTPIEQSSIQENHIVSLLSPTSFGLIIDNQGVDESTPGTNSGAALGSAIGQAAYIDRSFKGGNSYSAKTQLGVAILGGILGSSIDRNPVTQYHFRYAIKLNNGEIKYIDEVQSSAFRHPSGVCVSVPNIALIEQGLCSQTSDAVRAKYLTTNSTKPAAFQHPTIQKVSLDASPASDDVRVNCKIGAQAPVPTSIHKCSLIGGIVIP